MKHYYHSYGLRIVSDIELPELTAVNAPDGAPDVVLRRSTVKIPVDKTVFGTWHRFSPDASEFWWATVGGFRVSATGDVVDIDPVAGVKDDLIAFPLLGPVLSEVLRRKDYFVLHASAVEIEGQGVALMADKGTGKSSSCTALLRAGARILADDLVAVNPEQRTVTPGFGQVKLDQRMVDDLDDTRWIARPLVDPAIDKVRVLVPDLLAPSAVPAARLYVLRRGEEPGAQVSDIPENETLQAVIRYSYAVRFGKDLLNGAAASDHFRHAVATVNATKIKLLTLPKGLDRMAGLYDVVREDLQRDGAV